MFQDVQDVGRNIQYKIRAAKRGGQYGQFAPGSHCEGHYKCVARGLQILNMPGVPKRL